MQISFTRRWPVSFFAVMIVMSLPLMATADKASELDETVQHLIAYVASSDRVFIRNSGHYSAIKASEHLKDDIKTPEDFIRLCATRSILSGKFYRVMNTQGEVVNTSEWLTTELQVYRQRVVGVVH